LASNITSACHEQEGREQIVAEDRQPVGRVVVGRQDDPLDQGLQHFPGFDARRLAEVLGGANARAASMVSCEPYR
jgi:hypothetical protein